MCQWKAIYEQAIKDSSDIDPKEDDTVLSLNTIMFEWDFFSNAKILWRFRVCWKSTEYEFHSIIILLIEFNEWFNHSSYNIEQLQCNIIYTMHRETPGNGAYQDICINWKKKQGRIQWKYVF